MDRRTGLFHRLPTHVQWHASGSSGQLLLVDGEIDRPQSVLPFGALGNLVAADRDWLAVLLHGQPDQVLVRLAILSGQLLRLPASPSTGPGPTACAGVPAAGTMPTW